jgi:hypothetical protein
MQNAHLIDLNWTEKYQPILTALVDRYTSQGALGAWRVHRRQIVWILFVL